MALELDHYPQLKLISWSAPQRATIGEDEAFRLYEANWRFVDVATLTVPERAIIERLDALFGGNLLPGERAQLHHIKRLLTFFDRDLLDQTQCYLGGGAAAVLQLGEYRAVADLRFCCSSADGYRELRNVVNRSDLGALLKTKVRFLREIKADMYGLRTFIEVDGAPIKVEIVREARIDLIGGPNPLLPVTTLSRIDLFAEKILANTDRGLDKATHSRDIVDIGMMIDGWGSIPVEAWLKARAAYGPAADKAYRAAIDLISDRAHLRTCLDAMRMNEEAENRLARVFSLPEPTPTPW